MSFLLAAVVALQGVSEVRQVVTFRFLPGKSADAIGIFRAEAIPLYQANEPMLRFRAYREVESPEPLDLVVVSSFRGLAGMDGSNRVLAEEAARRGTRVGEIYGRISDVERRPSRRARRNGRRALLWKRGRCGARRPDSNCGSLPAGGTDYETLLRERLVPWEKEQPSDCREAIAAATCCRTASISSGSSGSRTSRAGSDTSKPLAAPRSPPSSTPGSPSRGRLSSHRFASCSYGNPT